VRLAKNNSPALGKLCSAVGHGAGYTKGTEMHTLETSLSALIDLLNSDRPLTPAPVDDIVDPYLAGLGSDKAQRRIELADAFHDKTQPSERRDMIYVRILRRIIP
jgi:hypothetical protein